MKTIQLIAIIVLLQCQSLHASSMSKSKENDSTWIPKKVISDDSIRQYKAQNIVISSTRFEEKVSEISESITLINNQYIENNFLRSTPELLIGTHGAWVQKTNHGGGSPFLRGLTGNQVLLMIDGFRLNNSITRYGPNQYFNTIDPMILNRIEVVRGSGSVLYGSDAIGGTIQVFTHEPNLTEELEFKPAISGRMMSGGMEASLRTELEMSSRDVGIIGGITSRTFGDLIAGEPVGLQRSSGYKELSGDIKMISKLSPTQKITASYQFTNQKDVPVYHKIELENYLLNHMAEQNRHLGYLKFEQKLDQLIIGASAAYHQSYEKRIKQKNGSDDIDNESDKIDTYSFLIESFYKPFQNLSLSTGIDVYYDLVASDAGRTNRLNNTTIIKRGLYPNDSKNLNIAGYSHLNYVTEKLNLNGGLRYNLNKIEFREEALGLIEIEPQALVWSLGALYKLSSTLHISAGINRSFRSPNIDDLGTLGIVDFRYEIPNYSLSPETGLCYEMGFRLDLSNNLSFNFNAFKTDLSDIITRVKSKLNGQDSVNGYQVYSKVNSASAEILGLESEFNWRFSDELQFSGNLSYTYGQDLSRNEPMRRIPPLFGSLRTDWYVINKLMLNAQIDWAAKQPRLAAGDKSDNRINLNGTPGWFVFNVSGNYDFGFMRINLGLMNLFDKLYRTHGSGIDSYGRAFWLGISLGENFNL